jgi:hypothetical protein
MLLNRGSCVAEQAAAFGLVIVGRIVINRAQAFQNIKLFAATDVLSERRIDGVLLRLMFPHTLSFENSTIVEREIGSHV